MSLIFDYSDIHARMLGDLKKRPALIDLIPPEKTRCTNCGGTYVAQFYDKITRTIIIRCRDCGHMSAP